MKYLASVYSLKSNERIRHRRYLYALRWLAKFSKQGVPVFSPVVHSHDCGLKHDLPCTFDFWSVLDYAYIDASDELIVLCMDGWKESIGVQSEIEYAEAIGLPIVYTECPDEFEMIDKVA